MDRSMHRAARELGVKGEYLFEAERRKRLLANAILIRIRDELATNPESDEFTFPLRGPVGKLERFVLSKYPHDISDRITARRTIRLNLDETVEPPLLTVSIGEPKKA